MSFDVFLQDFADVPRDRSVTIGQRVLEPLLDASRRNIVTGDGSAAVHFTDNGPLYGIMFNHIDGDAAWDVIYEIAVAGDWVILPVGGPVCVVADEHVVAVPPEARATGVVVVGSGQELRRAATST